jgi:heme-degrading monooxygenase HmoA
MISRQWRGIARVSQAAAYIAHLRGETFPQLANVRGFIDASILQRSVEAGVEFLIVTRWESIEPIHEFSGEDVQQAVVPEKVRAMILSYDRIALHYEVVQ